MADRDERQNNDDSNSSARPPFKRGGGSERNGSRSDRPSGRPAGGRPGSDRPRSGSRDERDRPALERPGRAGESRERERPEWQTRVERPRSDDRPKSPMIPEEITEKDLDLLVRVQMKTLSPENAERVARHLAMVGLLINDDPDLAHKHALAAADRAGRIGIVRETLGVTAYTVGDFALALRELQAFRRISGSNDQLPLMVDSERGLGRPDRALELGRSVDRKSLPAAVRANLSIAMSGARLDKGQNDIALTELEIPELNPAKVFDYSPQLFRAYASVLELLERGDEAKRWYDLAQRAEIALAQAAEGNDDLIHVVEEIEIPAPYEPRAPREERRGFGDRDTRPARRDSDSRPPRRDGDSRPARRDSDSRPPRRDSDARPPRRDTDAHPPREPGARPAWKKRDDR